MASTYTSRLRLEKQGDGDNNTTWGSKTNVVFDLIDSALAGMATIATTGGTTILTANNSAADEARAAVLKVTGVLVSNAILQIPAQTKIYSVWNATTGAFTVSVKTSGGVAVAVTQGKKAIVMCDGTDCSTLLDVATTTPAALAATAAAGTNPLPSASDHAHQRQLECIGIALGDETTVITVGTTKVTFRMPYAFTVTEVKASLTAASTSGIPTFDINDGGPTILSTKLTIDANEKTSATAAIAAVISDTALAADAEITIDVDVAGTGAAGGKVYLIGRQSA